MSKYIIDVTQLVHWQGRLTGIPRVIQELAVRFPVQDKREVVYVSWVKEIKDMCIVDLEATLAIRGSGIEYVKHDDGGVDRPVIDRHVEPSQLSIMRRSKNVAKKILRKMGAEDLSAITRLRDSLYQKDLQTYKRLEIVDGDVFFIGAGEWWDGNFISLVEKYHREGVKIVQVSHDMLPIVTPQFAGHATDSLATYNSRIMPIASLVLAVSESTKRDLKVWLTSKALPVPNIEVFRLGEDFKAADPVAPRDEKFTSLGLIGNDYILCVGTIEARKNHAILYYTYKLAKSRGVELPKILIVGRRGWKADDVYDYMTQDPETRELMIPMHDVSDEELSWLYSNSMFTIYPSLYEGWGMPIAESIMRGVPCLASNTSSMIEVAPGCADYFTPTSTDELLNGIMGMLRPDVLGGKKDAIRAYKPTSWDDSFKQVEKYMEIL
jgi:glycosyltransferase involved in cell wall biosynthesis